MKIYKLIDIVEKDECYGILVCKNDDISLNEIQKEINEIIKKVIKYNEEWFVDDIIMFLPKAWKVEFEMINGIVHI